MRIEKATSEALSRDSSLRSRILRIQSESGLDVEKGNASGFLVTLWSDEEFKAIADRGAEAWLAWSEEGETSGLLGYVVVSPISEFLDEFVQTPNVNTSVDFAFLKPSDRYLFQICIRENQRRKGVGQALLDHVLAEQGERVILTDFMKSPFLNQASLSLFRRNAFTDLGLVRSLDYRGFGNCEWQMLVRKGKS